MKNEKKGKIMCNYFFFSYICSENVYDVFFLNANRVEVF